MGKVQQALTGRSLVNGALVSVLGVTPALAEEIRMYNLAVGTSLASALVVNVVHARQAGLDFGWDDGKERARLLLNWSLPVERTFGPVQATTGLELALGSTAYKSEEQPMANLTPLFDWTTAVGPGHALLETGLGTAYLSSTELGPDQYSTNWHFSQILGVGYVYGNWQLGWRYQHISNGGIKKPNNGQNFHGLALKYHY
jgi:hypothetical protein